MRDRSNSPLSSLGRKGPKKEVSVGRKKWTVQKSDPPLQNIPPPKSVPIKVTATIGLAINSRKAPAHIRDEVKTALIDYSKSLNKADDVLVSRLMEKILSVEGVEYVDLAQPKRDILIESDERPVLVEVDIKSPTTFDRDLLDSAVAAVNRLIRDNEPYFLERAHAAELGKKYTSILVDYLKRHYKFTYRDDDRGGQWFTNNEWHGGIRLRQTQGFEYEES